MPKTTSSDYEIVPAGTYPAVLYRILDLGTQISEFKGEQKKRYQIRLFWELHGEERMVDGRPFAISKTYTYSSHEKSALRRDLEAWRGQKFTEQEIGAFQIPSLLNIGCLLGISHTENGDKTYTNITSISRMLKGMVAPKAENPVFCLRLTNEEFNQEHYDSLTDYFKELIAKSPEYQEIMDIRAGKVDLSNNQNTDEPIDDEIPF